jgi:hypothetical protein
MKLKKLIPILLGLIIAGAAIFYFSILVSSGTTGHIQFYNYDGTIREVKADMVSVIKKGGYSPPTHWNDYEEGADWRYDTFVYFKDSPKEIFLIQFNREEDEYLPTSVLALVGAFDGKRWYFNSDINRSEKERVQKRLEKEILIKMQHSYKKD